MDIIPDKRKVVGLVEQALRGDICLPNFQRDFVWTRDEVGDLVRSILRGYFIGSLLLLRSDPAHPPFAPVFLRGARPDHNEPRPELLVLDGQQRLSSLIYALSAPDLSLKDSTKRRWFFVDLDLLIAEPDNDEIVFDRAQRELRGLGQREEQYRSRLLPCTELLSQARFYKWRDGFEDWLRDNDADGIERFREEWRDAWTTAVTNFATFDVPLVELPRVDDSDPDSIGRVCAIFEKLNSTGVNLTVYDLLTARLYRSGIRLHDLWDEACRTHARLGAWSGGKADNHKFGVLVLRTLALRRGLDPKPKILIDLSPQDFEADWRRAAAAIERALELVTHVGPDGFGVFDQKWLPGFGLIPILAALRAEIDDERLGEVERTELRQWWWCNVFTERYSSAVESKSRKDYAEFTAHWFDGAPVPTVLDEARASIGAPSFRIRGSASYASGVYSGVFCLLALRNAKDWRRGEEIRLQELQDHHVFPQAYLKRHGVDRKADLNTIVNRTLISDETNGKIKDKAPADYVVNPEIFPNGAGEALLAPHFLDGKRVGRLRDATEELVNDELRALYDSFLADREQAIVEEIRRACGVDPTAPVAISEVDDEIALDVALEPADEEPPVAAFESAQS